MASELDQWIHKVNRFKPCDAALEKWLKSINMGKYCRAFASRGYTLEKLLKVYPSMKQTDLDFLTERRVAAHAEEDALFDFMEKTRILSELKKLSAQPKQHGHSPLKHEGAESKPRLKKPSEKSKSALAVKFGGTDINVSRMKVDATLPKRRMIIQDSDINTNHFQLKRRMSAELDHSALMDRVTLGRMRRKKRTRSQGSLDENVQGRAPQLALIHKRPRDDSDDEKKETQSHKQSEIVGDDDVDDDDDTKESETVVQPPSHDQGAPPVKKDGFKLHIAVDFGTDGLGIAYAYNGKVHVHSKFKSTRFASTVKPKTSVIIDQNTGRAVSFGMDAKHRFVHLAILTALRYVYIYIYM